jgi:hypothetical protein
MSKKGPALPTLHNSSSASKVCYRLRAARRTFRLALRTTRLILRVAFLTARLTLRFTLRLVLLAFLALRAIRFSPWRHAERIVARRGCVVGERATLLLRQEQPMLRPHESHT